MRYGFGILSAFPVFLRAEDFLRDPLLGGAAKVGDDTRRVRPFELFDPVLQGMNHDLSVRLD
jgi:hypothetical protein